jgi:copper resistance protein B
MSRIRIALLAAGAIAALASVPARAQKADPHAGHAMPAAAATPAPTPAPLQDPHAGHTMPATTPAAADPHAGHTMPPEADPHAGHAMPAAAPATADPHAGHAPQVEDHGAAAGTNLPAGTAPPPPVAPANAADAIYGSSAMAVGRHHLLHHHGAQTLSKVLFDIAEVKIRDGREGFEWQGEAWLGGDIDRLVVKTEGELEFGGPVESGEVQALYSRAIGPYFDLQAGVRYDFEPGPSRVYATLGVEGLAPGFFDVEGAVFLSTRGDLLARVEGSYDQRITQSLILEPRVELNLAAQNSPETGTGRGLSDAELGLRLRYDLAREFAPYVGLEYERTFGQTRRYRRDAGDEAGGFAVVAGVRFWF